MKKKQLLCAKTQKNHYFSKSQRGKMPPCPPQMTSLGYTLAKHIGDTFIKHRDEQNCDYYK